MSNTAEPFEAIVTAGITDEALQAVVDVRNRLKEAKALVKDLEAQALVMETDIMGMIRTNIPCVGLMQAFIDQKEGRSVPSWKDEYVQHFASEHGLLKKDIEAQMKLKYPAKISEILVIADTQKDKDE